MHRELPHGIKYEIIVPKRGIIKVGTDEEPVVSFSGRDAYIQYRLISFALEKEKNSRIEDTYLLGNLTDDEEIMIGDYVENNLQKLMQEAGVKHYIRFHLDYKCYYDFDTEMLFDAIGIKEKGKKINREPCKLSSSEKVIIEVLTKYPNSLYSYDDILDGSSRSFHEFKVSEDSMNTKMNVFRNYDPSIRATFVGNLKSRYKYVGIPAVWTIGFDADEISLNLNKIFNIVAYGEIIMFSQNEDRQLNIHKVSEVSSVEKLIFLGLDKELFDYSIGSIDKLVNSNNFSTVEELNSFFDRYCVSVNALWKQLEQKIKENLLLSLSVSTYFSETREYPVTIDVLKEYKATSERLERSLKQICPEIYELIVNTHVREDYFDKCDIEVKPDNVIDYIVALMLACLSYVNTIVNESEISTSKNRFRSRLKALIQNNPIFNFSQDDGTKNTFEWQIEEIRRLLDQVRHEIIEAGLNESVITMDKIYDLINKQSYKDDNSLLPDNINRRV